MAEKKDIKKREDKVQIWVKKETLAYEKELAKLQVELLKFQNHVKDKALHETCFNFATAHCGANTI